MKSAGEGMCGARGLWARGYMGEHRARGVHCKGEDTVAGKLLWLCTSSPALHASFPTAQIGRAKGRQLL